MAWLPVLGCCFAALCAAAVLSQRPGQAGVLAPLALACCAAAAAFVFDEDAVDVVSVTPRGGRWRRLNRLAAAVVPLSAWGVLVVLQPGHVRLAGPGWWLIAGAVVVLAAGLAAIASRRLVAAPGVLVAPGMALAVTSPVMVSGLFTWGSLYPIGDFPDPVRTVWLSVLGSGCAACAAALRPGVRP